MAQQLNEYIKPVKETIEFLRLGWDVESKKISIEGKDVKYNKDNEIIDTQPIRLVFRGNDFDNASSFLPSIDMMNKIIHMMLRKLEIDRKLPNQTLCDPLPENVPPYKEGEIHG